MSSNRKAPADRGTRTRNGITSLSSPFRDESRDATALRVKVTKLERRVATLGVVVRLLMILVRTTGVNLAKVRVSSAAGKSKILRGLGRAAPIIGRQAALRVLGLRPARLREWRNAERECELDDSPPCPRSVQTRLTLDERHAIREMVESDMYKHLSIRSLSLLAQRMGRVLAAYGTWCRLTRAHGWQRPRRRLYPAKPKIGVRAQRPGEWLHIDTTVIKLLDGTARRDVHTQPAGGLFLNLDQPTRNVLGAHRTTASLVAASASTSPAADRQPRQASLSSRPPTRAAPDSYPGSVGFRFSGRNRPASKSPTQKRVQDRKSLVDGNVQCGPVVLKR